MSEAQCNTAQVTKAPKDPWIFEKGSESRLLPSRKGETEIQGFMEVHGLKAE